MYSYLHSSVLYFTIDTWSSATNESLLSSAIGSDSILDISWIFFTKFDNSTFSWKQDCED